MRSSASVRVRYHWQEGSVPPPDYYEYIIELGPGPKGRITYLPGYAFEEPPAWNLRFEVDEEAWEQFDALVTTEGILEHKPKRSGPPPVGGSVHTLDVRTFHQEITFRSFGPPAGLVKRAIDAVRGLVPDDVWNELERRHDDYREELE